jgi:CheY-like chemotaxis protein
MDLSHPWLIMNTFHHSQRPPFWGLNFRLNPEARVLVVDDNPQERQPVLADFLRDCFTIWAATPQEAIDAFTSHGPFDVYMLDYDLGDDLGGWWPTAQYIRNADPLSIAKVVIVHSANLDAKSYYSIFPAALVIQWLAFATLLGTPLVSRGLMDQILAEAGPDASVETLRGVALKISKA